MDKLLPTLDPGILACLPADSSFGRLFEEAQHLALPLDQFDPEAIGLHIWRRCRRRSIRVDNALKASTECWRLFLSIHVHGHVGPAGVYSMFALQEVLGLTGRVQKARRHLILAFADAEQKPVEAVVSEVGRTGRQVKDWRKLDGYEAAAAQAKDYMDLFREVSREPDLAPLEQFEWPLDNQVHDAGGIEQVALRAIGHIRQVGEVQDEHRWTAYQLMNGCSHQGLVPPEALISLLAYACGIVDEAGDPVDRAIGHLMGTRQLRRYQKAAQQDAAALAAGQSLPRDKIEPDRSVGNWRHHPAYRSIAGLR